MNAQPASTQSSPPRMATFLRRADLIRWAGMASIGLGLAVLIVYAWVEYINDPASA